MHFYVLFLPPLRTWKGKMKKLKDFLLKGLNLFLFQCFCVFHVFKLIYEACVNKNGTYIKFKIAFIILSTFLTAFDCLDCDFKKINFTEAWLKMHLQVSLKHADLHVGALVKKSFFLEF